MITSGDIPNLMNGVSQQAAALRLPTQLELQENFYSTIVDGLKKRPPSEHIARIMDSAPAGAFFQILYLSETEQYVAVISTSSIRVFDFDGVEKTVTTPNGTGYLTDFTSATDDLRALTVADYTFIVNRKKVTAMGADVFPLRDPEALVNIVSGNYDKGYKITLDGTEKATYQTPSTANNLKIVANSGGGTIGDGGTNGDTPSKSGDPLNGDVGLRPNQAIATTEIAKRLYNQLLADPGNDGDPWGIGIHVNAIHIVNYDTDFGIGGEDGVNGNALKIIKDKLSKFSDLPNYGPIGFTVEITASNGTNFDNYWVEADKGDNPTNTSVRWREVPKPGTVKGFDASTMPHILVRNSDGTFTFKQATWDERTCGDGDKVNGDPSFVGRTIEDVFFFKNRLGFLSDESCILSKAGSYFDFFRTTATALLDDDPIDVAATHIKVSLLKHAVPFQDTLLLFSPQTQFRLAGNDLLTAKTASIRPLTEYSCSPKARPSLIGKMVFFTSDTMAYPRGHAASYEMAYDKKLETVAAAEITAHCPSYIPSPTRKLAGSVDESCLAVLTDGDPSALYVYRYYWAGDEKVQSSWSRWTFDGAEVLDASWINSDLYVVLRRADGIILERLRMDTFAADDELGFLVGLDRRRSISSWTYDSSTNTSYATLPYDPTMSIRAVVIEGTKPHGSEARVHSVSGSTLWLRGNYADHTLLVGYSYTSRAQLSTIYPRVPSQNGSVITKQEGRLQLQHLSVVYDHAGYFRVEVNSEGRDTSVNTFNGFVIGSSSGTLGERGLERGRINIPIMSRNTRVTIDIVNDHWLPASFVSATWRGIWNQTSREI